MALTINHSPRLPNPDFAGIVSAFYNPINPADHKIFIPDAISDKVIKNYINRFYSLDKKNNQSCLTTLFWGVWPHAVNWNIKEKEENRPATSQEDLMKITHRIYRIVVTAGIRSIDHTWLMKITVEQLTQLEQRIKTSSSLGFDLMKEIPIRSISSVLSGVSIARPNLLNRICVSCKSERVGSLMPHAPCRDALNKSKEYDSKFNLLFAVTSQYVEERLLTVLPEAKVTQIVMEYAQPDQGDLVARAQFLLN